MIQLDFFWCFARMHGLLALPFFFAPSWFPTPLPLSLSPRCVLE
jgi:hypothetical protein